jgi:NAD(P)-dependent dehydrogenase (short-subunit alcohol dehydrogenase family)
MELKDRIAIVTGAGSGIGRALAVEFARQSARVVCCGRRIERLRDTVAGIEKAGGEALAVQTDVTVAADVDRLMRATIERFGGLDVLFNNAGSFNAIGGLWEVDPEAWWNDVTINLRGPMLTARAALAIMMKQDRGVILNMNGGGSTYPLPGGSAYGSSKAALLRFTETLARELERVGSKVLVMAMGPGLVRTEMTELQAESELGRKWIPSTAECIAQGKTRRPDDCAHSTVELLRWIHPGFNGRIFGTGMDFAQVAQRLASADAGDALRMRMIP